MVPDEKGADAPSVYTVRSREDMGALLGITTETASRIMAAFKRHGLIHTSREKKVSATGVASLN